MATTVFERLEKKYLLSPAQQAQLLARISQHLKPDQYASYQINSVYYDTADYELIRHSIEKPLYKEKLRVRSYGIQSRDDSVFLELKKKFKGIVYKRRVVLAYRDALALLDGCRPPKTQIEREIEAFAKRYSLIPTVLISYDREAFQGIEDARVRLTFDSNLRFQDEAPCLDATKPNRKLRDKHTILMEIKVPGAIPLWLSHALNEVGIYPCSFSKYGTYYKEICLKQSKGGLRSA